MSRTQRSREAAESLRSAVDRTFQATVDQAAASRERAQGRAQDIVDELSQAAGRVREALDELRVATKDDVREIGDRLDALERRVAELERPAKAKPTRSSAGGRTAGAAKKAKSTSGK